MPVKKKNWDVGIRVSVLALYSNGKPVKEILEDFDMPKRTFYLLLEKARDRGWEKGQPVLIEYVEDAPRSGAYV
jgi:hypothetical protein